MSEIEIAQPADGSETHLRDKPIKGQNLNLDRDDEIYMNTVKTEGKWRYYNIEGKLIAETPAPTEVNADILSQWGNAVRARTTREHTFTKETTDGGIALPAGVDRESLEAADVPAESDAGSVSTPATVDDDPDSYVAGKIRQAEARAKAAKIKKLEILEQLEEIESDEISARAEVDKWRKMEAAINAED